MQLVVIIQIPPKELSSLLWLMEILLNLSGQSLQILAIIIENF